MLPMFKQANKKVIFFDFNDTLVDKQRSFYNAYAQALEEFTARSDTLDWQAATAVERYAKEWSAKPSKIKARTRASQKLSASGHYELRQLECMRRSLQGSPFPVTKPFVRSLLKRTKELIPYHPQLFPDVADTLRKLADSYQLAIISNGPMEKLALTLEHSGLKPLFRDEHIFAAQHHKLKKPHPTIFQTALTKLNIQPASAVMVGNSWRNDVQGASRSEIDAVWLQHHSKKTGVRRIGKTKVILATRSKQLLQLFE